MPKFVPRERKHRKLARQRENGAGAKEATEDANAEVILPASSAEKEARRIQLQDELRAQRSQDKISSKKRKRLDHYIETKLKREENAELIRKLASQKIDTNLLQSSKRLGQVTETKQDAFRRALQEREAGIDVFGDQEDILFTKRRAVDLDEFEAPLPSEVRDQPVHKNASSGVGSAQAKPSSTAPFGSGLKRTADGEQAQPTMKRRKRRTKSSADTRSTSREAEDNDEESEDEEGEYDTSSEHVQGSHVAQTLEWTGFDSAEEDHTSDSRSDIDDDASDDVDGTGASQSTNSDGESDVSSDLDENITDEEEVERPQRTSAFKQWAQTQRNDALGFTPSTAPLNDPAIKSNFKPRAPSPDLVAQSMQLTASSKLSRPKNGLTIARSAEIQSARLALPVVQEEQRIMEAIHNNSVVIVCGATGSGKTTQVPQMLFESGYGSHCGEAKAASPSLQNDGMIGVTQPRRVAAVSVANRVAAELGDYKDRVAHQVRYDTTVSKKTAMKFMTDGILLRELNEDFVLSKYSAIVIDEAHERSVNTDILIGTLSRIVKLREELASEQPDTHYPLKLVIMSATLRVADFAQNQRLFRSVAPPIVEAEGRQFPVTIHFARKTERDYVADIVKKVARGHKKLPAGAMLVFLTGQNEIMTAARMLKKAIGDTSGSSQSLRVRETSDQVSLEVDDLEFGTSDSSFRKLDGDDDSDADIDGLDEIDDNEFDLGEDKNDEADRGQTVTVQSNLAHILPLYAALPTSQQMRIFEPPPPGSRMIVIATNVAETSLTIPGVRYIFDCGRSKEKKYDQSTGVQTFEIDWISKASASQRTGRAGRTGPGHCWRLYSSAIYEEFFAEHSLPELLRTPIEGTILQLKSMNIDNVINFPFPTPPERSQLQTAETLLRNLGALDISGKITAHGQALMQYPVSPRYSKMLQIAATNGVLLHAIALVAGLAVADLYLPELQLPNEAEQSSDEDGDESNFRRKASALATTEAQKRHQQYTRAQALLARWDDRSDAIKLLTAVAVHADAVATDANDGSRISRDLYLRDKGMSEVQQLRQQLHAIIRAQHRNSSLPAFKLALPLASERERKMLNQIVAAGFLDQIAIRADLLPNVQLAGQRKPRSAIEVPYRPLMPLNTSDHEIKIEEQELQKCIYVHPSSVLARLSKTEMPAYVIYSHLSRGTAKTIGDAGRMPRTRMHPLTSISSKALAVLAQDTPLLELGKPVGKIEDKDGGKARICWISVMLRPMSDSNAAEWPLGSWRVEQTRDRKGIWKTTKILAR